MDAVDQSAIIQRLLQIASDSLTQRALPDAIFRIGCDKDGRDSEPHRNQILVEVSARHCRHVNVSDEAGGRSELVRREKCCRRREHLDGISIRLKEPSQRVPKGLVVINNGNEDRLWHGSFRCVACSSAMCLAALSSSALLAQCTAVAKAIL